MCSYSKNNKLDIHKYFMKEIISTKHKIIICYASFIGALLTGATALFLPPTGVIDSSVLWFTAQLLLLVSSILGYNINFGKFGHTENKDKLNN